jgi:hypothetical protein
MNWLKSCILLILTLNSYYSFSIREGYFGSYLLEQDHDIFHRANELTQDSPASAIQLFAQLGDKYRKTGHTKGVLFTNIMQAHVYRENKYLSGDSGIFILRQVIREAKQNNEFGLLAFAYGDMGKNMRAVQLMDSSFYYFMLGQAIAEEYDFHRINLAISNSLANSYMRIGRRELAVELLLHTLESAENNNSPHQYNLNILILAKLYTENKNIDHADSLLNVALPWFQKTKNSHWINYINLIKAKIACVQKNYDQALEIYNKLNKKYDDEQFQIDLFNLKRMLTRFNSDELLQDALNLRELLKNHDNAYYNAVSSYLLAWAFKNNEDCEAVIEECNRSINAIGWNAFENYGDSIFKIYTHCLNLKGKLSKSNEVIREFEKVKIEVDSRLKNIGVSIAQIDMLMARNNSLRLEKDLLLLKQKNRTLMFLISIGFILFTAIGIIVYLRIRILKNKKDKNALSEQIMSLKKNAEIMQDTANKVSNTEDHYSQNEIDKLCNLALEGNWLNFTVFFNKVHKNFIKDLSKLSIGKLSKGNERLAILIFLKLSDKEIQNILSIGPSGLKKAKHRLRSKLNKPEEITLSELICSL